ncbi:hypothetical protein Bca101_072290 [Brassica carinata]
MPLRITEIREISPINSDDHFVKNSAALNSVSPFRQFSLDVPRRQWPRLSFVYGSTIYEERRANRVDNLTCS